MEDLVHPKMAKEIIFCFLFSFNIHLSTSSFVFHENTNVMFTSSNLSNNSYFGYSIVLTTDRLYIGAPRTKGTRLRTGDFYICPLDRIDSVDRVKCNSGALGGTDPLHMGDDFKNHNMWLGASMVATKDRKLWVAAPRYTSSGYGLEGMCYSVIRKQIHKYQLLNNKRNAKVTLDGSRPSYGKLNAHVGYYISGLLGFSLAVSKINTVIFGAPGLMAQAGGVISPNLDNLSKTIISNPYYTTDIDADDYLGYSVESGIFEKNGSMLFIGGAPRADLARGKVLIFEPPISRTDPLNISAKIMGPQVGSYFGASLCSTDINGDGLDDLLVGAPTFVEKNHALPYDQGAVFIYMAKKDNSGFVLAESGHVMGSRVDGAWFGTAIADLGDVDGDNYIDIAVGAPYEDNGIGAVYIYRGNILGLKPDYAQRIQPPSARGFGWSISKGIDIDGNKCNDVAIGAYNSDTSYLYRCIPTIFMKSEINAPARISLQPNVTNFNITLRVSAPPNKFDSSFQLHLTGKIIVDSNKGRAVLVGEPEFNIILRPGSNESFEKEITVNVTANLIKPINITYELKPLELMNENSTKFLKNAVRLSEDSAKKNTKLVQVLIGCGDDYICNPWFNITLVPLESPFIPGESKIFGVALEVTNVGEPAYGASLNITLPMQPKRLPEECSYNETVMTCHIPQPFFQNETISWDIEMEFDYEVIRNDSIVTVELYDRYNTNDNMTDERIKNVTIEIQPESGFVVIGQSMPNTSALIFRDDWEKGANISFQHTFQITNLGPSDCHTLIAHIQRPDKTRLASPIPGCEDMKSIYNCTWSVPVKTTVQVSMTLLMDLSLEGKYFEENMTFDAISTVFILEPKYVSYELTTRLILEPASIPIWFIIGPCIVIGLILFALLTFVLYRFGFFSRGYNKLGTVDMTEPKPGSSETAPSAPEEEGEEIEL